MKNKITILITILLFIVNSTCKPQNKEIKAQIHTDYGDITIKLYNETPQHRDNFIKLVKAGFYNDRIFHRVIPNFMIQGGDETLPENITNNPIKGTYDYKIPAEINPKLYHKRGAIAAARMGDDINPNQESSATQFYIVQGEKFTLDKLNQIEEYINNSIFKKNYIKYFRQEQAKYTKKDTVIDQDKIRQEAERLAKEDIEKNPFHFSQEQINTYLNVGGTPHLDMNYTVFGEIVSGMDVMEKIAAVQTAGADRPIKDVHFSVKLLE